MTTENKRDRQLHENREVTECSRIFMPRATKQKDGWLMKNKIKSKFSSFTTSLPSQCLMTRMKRGI